MVTNLPSLKQYTMPPDWPHLDTILCDHLGWLHHSLSCDLKSAIEVPVQLSSIISDFFIGTWAHQM